MNRGPGCREFTRRLDPNRVLPRHEVRFLVTAGGIRQLTGTGRPCGGGLSGGVILGGPVGRLHRRTCPRLYQVLPPGGELGLIGPGQAGASYWAA